MPEIAEVRVVKDTLKKQILNKKIIKVKILYKDMIVSDINTFISNIENTTIKDITTCGKWLIFNLGEYSLLSHLRMEGKYFILDDTVPISKHDHVIFYLDDGSQLRYNDVRKFGRMELIDKKDNYDVFKDLGPEPFSKDFNLKYCKNYLADKKLPIKQVLLDQSFVAGIGNIYADEILFAIKVHPETKANRLSDEDIKNLISSTRKILNKAIKAGGTTIRSYTSSLGVTGRFQLSLNVHTMKKCPICNSDIDKIVVGGRGTYYCPKCQKIK